MSDHSYEKGILELNGKRTEVRVVTYLASDKERLGKGAAGDHAYDVPDTQDGYPVVALSPFFPSPELRSSGIYTFAASMLLIPLDQLYYNKKYAANVAVYHPAIWAPHKWKYGFYRTKALATGKFQLETMSGYFVDGKTNMPLYDLCLDSFTTMQTKSKFWKQIWQRRAADVLRLDGKNITEEGWRPCLIRTDIAPSFTLKVGRPWFS